MKANENNVLTIWKSATDDQETYPDKYFQKTEQKACNKCATNASRQRMNIHWSFREPLYSLPFPTLHIIRGTVQIHFATEYIMMAVWQGNHLNINIALLTHRVCALLPSPFLRSLFLFSKISSFRFSSTFFGYKIVNVHVLYDRNNINKNIKRI